MKISARWLRQLFSFDVPVEQAAQVLTATGLEVEGVERVEDVPGGLAGVVVGRVSSVSPHPNADRLRVCKVDVGSEVLDIVCGASNVAEGQKVPVATVGATLHPSTGEPFKIKKGKIRGEVSMGMICAEDELGLGSGHDGILVLDDSAQTGQPLAEFIGMDGDDVIEIGLTPNRNDAMGHWGVARDLRAGLLHGTVDGVGPVAVDDLKWPTTTKLEDALKAGSSVALNVVATEDCPHYLAVELHNVAVGPSPDWAQKQLRAIGVQPINNVVDATNLVLHEFGNPLHAFDLDRIGGQTVTVRKANQDEPFVTLDDQERKLDARDLVIADATKPMCLAGVYGGADSGVSDGTSKVLLEAAWFHPVTVRKTAKRHTLSTDASFRFERGVDPATVRLAAERCVHLLQEWAGATVGGAVEHKGAPLVQDAAVEVSLNWLFGFLGTTLELDRLRSIFASLDIEITSEGDDVWQLSVPAYRSDVTRPADIAEEVLRIHGFDHVPLPDRMTGTLEIPAKPNREDVLFGWRELLVSLGFTEIMSNSLTKASYAELVKDRDLHPEASVHMLNPLSADLGAMRQSLIFQGLEAVARNSNHQHPDLRMFEFGRSYRRGETNEEGRTSYVE
ncbi:MAG: phenylalanine--tRNA ligase subunit beta, partial [Flavobacteriales bacterium]|nr:phenylalanine--tRNA ligase subunit beta [Flavobacteriales bacterium]